MTVAERHNVTEHGVPDGPPMLFAHGFGCDQNMWRFVWPAFADDAPDRAVRPRRRGRRRTRRPTTRSATASLDGYADDVLAICRELDLRDVVFVGHSVSAMIGVLAAAEEPDRFAHLVLVGPSPRYVDDEGYVGGFSARTSRGCSSRSTPTTSAGRARWRR